MTSPGAGGDNLDFEKADFGDESGQGARCGGCGRDLRLSYFEVNGVVVCPDCRAQIADLDAPEGGVGRFVRATLLGLLGGAAGAAVWYAVATLFSLEIGLIAILVGWLVGTGVSRGSGGRGGLRYQFLAAFLTYASIVTTYIPPIYSALMSQSEAEAASAGSVPAAPVEGPAPTRPVSNSAETSAPGDPTTPIGLRDGLAAIVLSAGLLYAIAFAAPFLMGVGNAIGILIIGFAVYQAWKMNARRVLEVKGPFRVAAAVTQDADLPPSEPPSQ